MDRKFNRFEFLFINANKSPKEMKYVCLILDDIFADVNLHHSPVMRSMFMRSRHYGLAIISAVQFCTNLPPICRSNSDWIICGQQPKHSQELLFQGFSCIPKDDFFTLMNKGTRDYGFVVINNNSVKDNSIDHCFGIIRVPEEFVK